MRLGANRTSILKPLTLLENARLLAGNLTVVGKVTYIDPQLPGGNECPQANERKGPASSAPLREGPMRWRSLGLRMPQLRAPPG
jgi:hypothetical protein